MSTILFFDTETTNLPQFKKPNHDPSQPLIMQLGAILADESGEILDEFCTYLHIGDAPINPYAQAAHGITRKKCNEEGIPPVEAFLKFHSLTPQCEALTCHNYNFDIKMIQITSAQIQGVFTDPDTSALMMSDIEELPYYCTMASTISYCNLPFPSGRKGKKFPKLEELHRILFEEDFEGAHDAMADVRATMRCYFELKSRGVM